METTVNRVATGHGTLEGPFAGERPEIGPAILRALQPGEWVLARAGLHWSIYVPPIAVSWLWGILLVWAGATGIEPIFEMAALVELVVVPTLLLWAYGRMRTSFAVLTNNRVVVIQGPWPREVYSIDLDNVDAVHVRRSLLGGMFGAGSLYITALNGSRFGLEMHDLAEVERFANKTRNAADA